ncbi:MAG: class I SAM-dependent methyltransferase [Aphanizomenon sp.]|jgi:SAM-dependent methyltransferase
MLGITTVKRNLFDAAAHKRVKRVLNKDPFIFHGFNMRKFYSMLGNSNSSFLDVGCGFGIDMSQAVVMGFTDVVGVDIKMYDDWLIAKSSFPDLRHIELTSSSLPFKDSTFDFVNSQHVLEHCEDDCFLLQEMHRVLKENGLCVIGVPNSQNILTIFKKMLGLQNPYLDPTHLREYTLSEIKQKVEAVGFEILDTNKEGFVLPIPRLHRLYHFFTTCYFDFIKFNNLLGHNIPYCLLGYNVLVRKSS